MPLPNPKRGEKQKDFISRCIGFVKGENPKTPDDQAAAMCYTTWRDSKKKEQKIDNKIKFNVPIMEKLLDDKGLLIKGVAINNTTTRNGVYYSPEELDKGAYTLTDCPILKDHYNSVDFIVGRTEKGYYDTMAKCVKFEGRIHDLMMIEKIQKGMIKAVSVGCLVAELPEMKNEKGEHMGYEAKGITFVEISLVAVPADPNAGISLAIAEMLKERYEDEDIDGEDDSDEDTEDIDESANPDLIQKDTVEEKVDDCKPKEKNIERLYSITAQLGEKVSIAIPKARINKKGGL